MTTTTARAIIKRAFQILGVYGAGVTIGATDENDAFLTLTGMVDTWKGRILRAPFALRQTFTLTDGDGEYTLGPAGADLTGVRPVYQLSRATRIDNDRETPLIVLTRAQYEAEPDRTTEGYVSRIFVDHLKVPLANLFVFPVPSTSTQIAIYHRQEVMTFATLTTSYDLPEGYYEAFVYNLALRIGPEHGFPLDEDGKAMAQAAIDVLTGRNEADAVPTLELDAGLVACERDPASGYDWMTGEGG
jgi:hypothetical protein